jgi:membrane-bound metal-dependent hydrolase YbcI (DUF457 family)
MGVLSFYAGISFAYTLSPFNFVLLAVLLFLSTKKYRFKLILFAVLGCVFAIFHDYLNYPVMLPKFGYENKVVVEALIDGIPKYQYSGMQQHILVTKYHDNVVHMPMNLNCYQQCPHLGVGSACS